MTDKLTELESRVKNLESVFIYLRNAITALNAVGNGILSWEDNLEEEKELNTIQNTENTKEKKTRKKRKYPVYLDFETGCIIYTLCVELKIKSKEISRLFGISQSTVWAIKRKYGIWKSVFPVNKEKYTKFLQEKYNA